MAVIHFCIKMFVVMPRQAPELECSAEDKASLADITKSRIEEARAVERARIILACPGRQGDSASGAGVGGLHPHRYQVAQALRTVGSERTAGPAAAGQAGYVRRRVSQPV